MEHLDDFGALREKIQDAADFVTIYISEAHPTEQGIDTWENYNLRQHRTMEDKIEASRILKREAGKNLDGSPILVDSMCNEAEKNYSALPERLYVILDNKIVYAGDLGPFGYSIKEVDQFLQKLN